MGTISLVVDGKAVGPTSALVASPQFYPIIVSVTFDYASSGQATVQNIWVRGGEWADYGTVGTLTSNTSFFIASPIPGLRLNVTRLAAGQIELAITGADDGSINVPTILTDDAGGYLLDDTTGLPLIL